MKQGGTVANTTGKSLEDFIESKLVERNYAEVRAKVFRHTYPCPVPIYAKQYFIGKSVYDTNLFCDFIIYHPKKHPACLVIESKWQQAAGSVDEKFPYLVKNIQDIYPHKTVLLLDGGGYKAGAESWIRGQVGGNLEGVFNMSEFQRWANKGGI